MQNRRQKNAETLLLEPTKNKDKKLPQARQAFVQRKTWKPASHQTKPMKNVLGTRMRKSRTPASFVPKPLWNCSRKNPETLLLESTKKTFGTHKEQCFGNRCRQPSRKACVRCLWRSGADRRTQRKKSPWRGTIVKYPTVRPQSEIVPKPCENGRQTFAQRETWKPASHQAKLKKKVFGTRVRKSRTPAGFVPKPLRNCSRKNPETSPLEPTKNKEIVPKPCETGARKMPKRCFWNRLKTKKKSCFTLLLEPTKNKEKKLPQARQTFA